MNAPMQPFTAEVSRLLDIVVHSLYSDRAIFLRELIANAADACEKLRYESVTNTALTAPPESKISLVADSAAKSLIIADNGIGMDEAELRENLGTIARSGTAAFLSRATAGDQPNPSLIGQFGVGFYAAFMVADRVEVLSRKAGSEVTWLWSSDGKNGYEIAKADTALSASGTRITLRLKPDALEYLEESRLKEIVRAYADHISLPIFFGEDVTAPRLNQGAALWLRPKSDVTAQQYTDFYRYVGAAWDEPAFTLHWKAEGALEYKGLLFVPSSRPADLFDPKREHSIKLYVHRIFITAHAPGLVPSWLRFLRGVIDSDDLPLNVSREMLQNNPVLSRMRMGITRKLLSELEKWAGLDAKAYEKFWINFGPVLKEGLYEDQENRDNLMKLVRARSTAAEGLISLDDYVSRMPEGQKEIYYIVGEDEQRLARSPHIEALRAEGKEVLLLTDSVDSFWPNMVHSYKDKVFTSATQSAMAVSPAAGTDRKDSPAAPQSQRIVDLLKTTLSEFVKDVRFSTRLTESPVCLVADVGDPDMKLERLLRQHGQMPFPVKRILEINPNHPLIKGLEAKANNGAAGDNAALKDAAWLLLDQARLLEGDTVVDPGAFAKRLSAMMTIGLEHAAETPDHNVAPTENAA